VAPGHATPWTQWTWQAGQDGVYTLLLGLNTRDENNRASYGGFDDIFITPANLIVPEPAALTILGLGGMIYLARRKRRHNPQS
jgi:hypothetical protein